MRSNKLLLLVLLSATVGCAKPTSTEPLADSSGGSGGGSSGNDGGGPIDSGGRCAGVDCTDLNALCRIGRCDPADGVCKPVAIGNNAACDDGDPCTTNDVCAAGTCAGIPVDCRALDDACHAGSCDPASGMCEAVALADGAVCDDGSACTTGDACAAGRCTGAAVDCSALNDTCSIGACDPADGTCRAAPAMPGAACDDANLCTWTDTCAPDGCAGVALDCDPLGVSFPPASDTPVRGGSAGDEFLDDCPFGEVPVGIDAEAATGPSSGLLTRVVTLCGAVSLTATAAGATATVSPGARVPEAGGRGTAAGTGVLLSQRCPSDRIAVGFEGGVDASGRISQLALRCAPLSVTGSAFAGYAVSAGAATALAPVGAVAGTPFSATDCPAGTVARGAHLLAGEVLNGFGLRCGTPTLRLVTTAPRVGGAGGGVVEDDCPEGQVPIGIEAKESDGFYWGVLSNFATRCGVISVTAAAGGLDVSVSPGARLPATSSRGSWSYAGELITETCPPNQAIVGLSGASDISFGAFAGQLTLRCAPFTVSGDATEGYAVSVGAIADRPPVGTNPGTPAPTNDCPTGMLGRGFYVNAGEIIDGVALRCAPPRITVP